MKDRKKIGQQIITETALYIRSSQRAIKDEQDKILRDITDLQESGYTDEMSFDLIPSIIQRKIEYEILASQALDDAIKINSDTGYITPYGIRFNKLKTVLEGVKEMATDANIYTILSGHLPLNYDNSIGNLLPTLGRNYTFWGTSKSTLTSTLLQFVHNVISSEGLKTAESPIFHTFTCHKDFKEENLVKSLFIDPESSPIQVNIPHSGYSFGGDRSSEKLFRPQDSTSIIEACAQLPSSSTSSADLYLTWRTLNSQPLVRVNKDWFASPSGQSVKLFDLNRGEPQPGDIWCIRKFDETKIKDFSLGYSGHAGIYLGRENDQIIMLAYNRDMPDIEGSGLEYRYIEENSESMEQFYLTRNDSDFEFKDLDLFDFNSIHELGALTSFADKIIEDEFPETNLTGELI